MSSRLPIDCQLIARDEGAQGRDELGRILDLEVGVEQAEVEGEHLRVVRTGFERTAIRAEVFGADETVRRVVPAAPDAHWSEFERGLHFPAMEAPAVLAGDLRNSSGR